MGDLMNEKPTYLIPMIAALAGMVILLCLSLWDFSVINQQRSLIRDMSTNPACMFPAQAKGGNHG